MKSTEAGLFLVLSIVSFYVKPEEKRFNSHPSGPDVRTQDGAQLQKVKLNDQRPADLGQQTR